LASLTISNRGIAGSEQQAKIEEICAGKSINLVITRR
jgi:hypothetical protein